MPRHSPQQPLTSPWIAGLAVVALLGCGAEPDASVRATQQAASTLPWFSPDGSAAGTPPEVIFDAVSSTPFVSYFDVKVHGFYLSSTTVLGSNYYGNPGVPTWTSVKPSSTNGQTFPRAEVELALLGNPNITATRTDLSPAVVYTNIIPGASTSPLASYPVAEAGAVDGRIGGIRSSHVKLYPFEYSRVACDTGWCPTITLHWHARFAVSHAFASSSTFPVSRDRAKLAALRFANWGAAKVKFPEQATLEASVFLLVPQALGSAIPMLKQRYKERGFETTSHTVLTTATCGILKSKIRDWAQARAASVDKYVLIVGDDGSVPSCPNPYATSNVDALYASLSAAEFDRTIHVGRLPVASEAELSSLLARIDAYALDANTSHDYATATLAADGNDVADLGSVSYGFDDMGQPTGRIAWTYFMEKVAAAAYAHPPAFDEVYGEDGALNADLTASLNAGRGVLAFTGHGSTTGWGSWDAALASWQSAQISALASPTYPVVWSAACSTVTGGAGFARPWLLTAGRGAVSFVGSDEVVDVGAEDHFVKGMFRALYDGDVTRQGMVLDLGVIFARPTGFVEPTIAPDPAHYMYRLMGDPTMRVRRAAPRLLIVDAGPFLTGNYPVTVMDGATGQPVEGALVSIYKQANGVDEVFVNGYTSAAGVVTLATGAPTSGTAMVTVADDAGNMARRVVSTPPVIAP